MTVLSIESLLLSTTDANKDLLLSELDEIQATGSTNFEAALTIGFDILETSRDLWEVASSGCTIAILLLTDSEITEGKGAD